MFTTRIAPSPTGNMHIGTVRTAYFNWLAARSTGGQFILRIDDTDKARSEKKYVDVILDTMNWLGLDYDQLVYQSDRFEIYRKRANDLLNLGWAKKKDDAVVLNLDLVDEDGFKTPYILPTNWTDEIMGKIAITHDNILHADGMVLIKSDGTPSYNFCTVIDDIDMGVNYIIRGNDHTTNTAKQVILFDIFKSPLPKFAHAGLIGLNGKVLSKRDDASNVLYYREKGYDPEAVLNFVVRLGWGPTKDDKTTSILPKERMLELFFSGGKMLPRMANMDLLKLDSFDRKYKGRKENATRA